MVAFSDELMLGTSIGFNRDLDTDALIFEPDNNTRLTRTPGAAGTEETQSVWFRVKRAELGSTQYILTAGEDSSNSTRIAFTTADRLQLRTFHGGAQTSILETSALFKDTTAVYEFLIQIDINNATAADRLRMYRKVSNSEDTWERIVDFDSSTISTSVPHISSTVTHAIGCASWSLGSDDLAGIVSEILILDGYVPSPESFNKPNTLTYGTQGSRIEFSDNSTVSAFGTDTSGNGNDWTVTNFATTDQVSDTWSNNAAIYSILQKDLRYTTSVTEGGLLATFDSGSTGFSCLPLTINAYSGLHYLEFEIGQEYVGAGTDGLAIGLVASDANFGTIGGVNSSDLLASYNISTGVVYEAGVSQYTGSSWNSSGAVGRMAIDYDNGKVWFGVGATWQNSGDPEAGTGESATFTPGTAASPFAGSVHDGTPASMRVLVTEEKFNHTPPTGFKAYTTANLPKPVISDGSKHFQVITWIGDDTEDRLISTDVDFDLVWVKNLDAAVDHELHDRLRGDDKALEPNSSDAESTLTGYFAFVEGGFTVSKLGDNGATNRWNNNGDRYVAWCWKLGGAGVSNTDGTVTTEVSVNDLAGVSLVVGPTDGTDGATYGHGLSERPELVITKHLNNSSGNWVTKHFATMSDDRDYLYLNTSDAIQTAGATTFIKSGTNNSVVEIGDSGQINDSSGNLLLLCIRSIVGYSKIGTYTGNGSTDGPCIHCGFKPRYILVKRVDSSGSWVIRDTVRNTYNVVSNMLFAESTGAEVTSGADIIITANGFKITNSASGTNASGGEYMYIAFAEYPFGGKGVAPATAF